MKDSNHNSSGVGHTDYYSDGVLQWSESAVGERDSITFRTRNGEVRGNGVSPTDMGFSKRSTHRNDGLVVETLGSVRVVRRGLLSTRGGIGGQPDNGWTPATEFPHLLETARSRLIEKLRSGPNLAVDAAEWASTRQLFAEQGALHNRIGNILDAIASDRKRSRRKFARIPPHERGQRVLDAFTASWLEARYGWLPLAGSISDLVNQVMRRVKATRFHVVGTARDYYDTSGSGFGYANVQGTVRRRGERRARLSCMYRRTDSSDSVWDYTSLNPVGVAYELLTLSFVLDWVYDIGSALEYAENFYRFSPNVSDCYVTYTGHEDVDYRVSGIGNIGSSHLVVTDSATATQCFKNRVVLGTLPLPTMPQFRPNIGAVRWMDAVTLFHNMVAKKMRVFGVTPPRGR